jgi:hypothetical protein
MIYEDVFKALNKEKVRYLVVGGVAVNLYGFPRATLDLDLVISLDENNRKSFYQIMKDLNFRSKKSELARKLILGEYPPEKIKVVTFYRDEFELIDVFIHNPFDFENAYEQRKIFRSGKMTISTIPYDLLISMKRASDRDRDLVDIGYLEKIKKAKQNGKK